MSGTKKSILFFTTLLLHCIMGVQAQREKISRDEYIKMYRDIAIKEMKRSGIPASITLGQGILETNHGNSTLARKANNHFGIKCHSDWKGRKVYHDDDRRNECFRSYRNAEESFRDHSDFILRSPRYKFLFELKPDDYKGWARGLKKAGYATHRQYDKLLIKIIEENQLYKYDSKTRHFEEMHDESIVTSRISENNRVQYVVAQEGESYLELAKKFDMMPWEIYKYNDLPRNADITPGQRIYIQPKRNRAAHGHNIHEVNAGETMYTISQKYAVKLDKLYKKNRMEPGEPIETGQEIHLRKKKKRGPDDPGFFESLFSGNKEEETRGTEKQEKDDAEFEIIFEE
jgi:LysM repeat protein